MRCGRQHDASRLYSRDQIEAYVAHATSRAPSLVGLLARFEYYCGVPRVSACEGEQLDDGELRRFKAGGQVWPRTRLFSGAAPVATDLPRCPDCGRVLELGPTGGHSVNWHCAGDDCGSRFNDTGPFGVMRTSAARPRRTT